ncbi:Homeobox-leucine zipper protein HDG11 [Cytospora mali]|uniref:Homeobox-leucine zipper protein HDG11 n=1 Tax=Cytospora mali TaxID=578113 RepID=A0A194W5L3_CYTMA|nr:Homeobox-leucine zipper protein HDG11 [Valsa mali]
MLVSRQHDSEQNHWSMSKYETIHHKPASIPRMSNNFDTPLSTQSEWHGQQYSFIPPGENPIYAQSYSHGTSSNGHSESRTRPRSAIDAGSVMDVEPKSETSTLSPSLGQRRSIETMGLRQQREQSPTAEQSSVQGDPYAAQKAAESTNEGSVASTDTRGMSLGSNPVSSVSSAGQGPELPPSHSGNDEQPSKQEDDDEVIDEYDMAEGDGEAALQQMTPAERTAARRKMKRFRLTHQQTRFLMSEFAKQPHPDAAHRERLSREIPGLSPRQVQVWFQNRRAKIKRLTADDRERMIKMRAVPDDFDNVQALHSPYGAVHGLGTPMASPVGFGPGSYPDHLMRGGPLVVDVRRAEGNDHMSPTGLSPAFGNIGFSSSASMSNPELLSPMSQESNDRYDYSNHMTPLSTGHRTSNPFTRQSGLDTSLSMHNHHSRQQMRPLQPLQLRETLSRSRPDNLQSPLRSSMSWKGDSIDYATYNGSPQPLSGRQHSVYQPPEGLSGPPTTLGGYETSSYAGSTVTSPTHMSSYPNFQSNSFQDSQNRSRLRASSATLPLGLSLSPQRSYSSSQQGLRSATSPSHRHAAVTSAPYSTGFSTSPLTTTSEFSLPRTSAFPTRPHEYSMPHMSAPIAAPNDFSQAFQASMSSGPTTRTPMRDAFGGGGPLGGDRSNEEYGGSGADLRRRRSFTIPQGGPAS